MESRALARAWALSGGDLGTPGVAEDFCAGIVSPLQELPGHLGVFGVIDRDRSRLVGISFWETAEAMAASWGYTARVVDEELDLSQLEMEGPSTYEVHFSHFHQAPGRPRVIMVDRPLARISVVSGGTITDPSMLAVLQSHFARSVELPGCVGLMLLVDAAEDRVLGVSFWADQRSMDRTAKLSAETVASFTGAAGGVVADVADYEVLVIAPMARQVH
jgi:hypothetical protein